MDYEKKYKEALERAQKVIRAGGDVATEIVQHIFPELYESEDAQSIKKIEQLIRLNTSGAEKTQLLAYLEKQKKQKPAEWSEEDEKMLDTIVSALGQYTDYKAISGTTVYATPRYSKEIAWLRSLRPSWKPSEEQMDALKELIDDANRAGWVTPGATELYEQLKKL